MHYYVDTTVNTMVFIVVFTISSENCQPCLLAFGMLVWVASVILDFLYMISPSYQVVLLWLFSGCFLLLFYVSSYMDIILLWPSLGEI